ncbi:hypothetical protein [Pseudomonas profundi]|uniref:hypothetical protein n=1 Tax=Pseudomonas profundi TaxID=1981513 RepID=UPI00123BA16F|nr:hypothetical protein [Pseudomonas profundi]
MKTIREQKWATTAKRGCDACRCGSTAGDHLEFATLQADWGPSSQHDGEKYEVRLCESCFFGTLGYVKQLRRSHVMFEDDYDPSADARLGLIVENGNHDEDKT